MVGFVSFLSDTWGRKGHATVGAGTPYIANTISKLHGAARPGGRPPGPSPEPPPVLGGLTPGGVRLIGVGLMFCVAVGDYLTGAEVNFTLLYLAPIAFVTWFTGIGAGVSLSVLSGFTAFVADGFARTAPLPAVVLAWNQVVQLGTFLALALLLGVLKEKLLAEQHAARTDHLTQVANRRAFVETAAVELERARRTGRPLTVAYLDIDDFKHVNDVQGHARGDALLASIAATLAGATRTLDLVARLGGDEFGLLLVDTDGPTAESLLHRLRAALDQAVAEPGSEVTFSIGAATFLQPARSVDEMMALADQLMYDAKRAGKNALRLDVVSSSAHAAG